MGITLAIRIAVVVFVSPFAGRLADYLGQRRTLVAADMIRALVVVGFLWVEAIWQIYLLAFLLNLAASVFTPVYKAIIPGLVSQTLYPRALSYGSIAYDLANIAGPALAGLIIAFLGFRANFAANGITFLLSACLIFGVPYFRGRARNRAPADSPALLHGVRAMLSRPSLRLALLFSLQISIISGFVLVATIDYVKNELALPDAFYAWAMFAYGVGSVAAALSYGNAGPRSRNLGITAAPPVILGVLLAAGLATGFPWLVAAWILAGAAQVVLGIRGNELLAAYSAPDERPHIYAAHFSLSHAGWGVTYPLAGFTTAAWGFHGAALLFASLSAIVMGLRLCLRAWQ